MTIQSFKMGPGTLKFDTAGVFDVSCQVTACSVTPTENVDTGDALDVLCGETLAGEDTITYTWQLTATLVQDLAAAGVVAWSWDNKGEAMSFEFIPNTAAARKVTGTVRVAPLAIGGDVKSRPTSDLSWAITDTPALTAV